MAGDKNRFAKFFVLLRRMPGADKETLVGLHTGGRTVHLGEMSQAEYDSLCRSMEREAVSSEEREAYLMRLREARSRALRQMQLWGVDTADWSRVDAFCQDRRIAGKSFRELHTGDLYRLAVKLRAMNRKKNGEIL